MYQELNEIIKGVPLREMFLSHSDGIIRENAYFSHNVIHRYLVDQLYDIYLAQKDPFRGGVYFLWNREKGIFKIGASLDLGARIRQLMDQAKLFALDKDLVLFALHPTIQEKVYELEHLYHNLFKPYAYQNEWFCLSSEELLSVLKKEGGLTFSYGLLPYYLIYSCIDLRAAEHPILEYYPSTAKELLAMPWYQEVLHQHKTLLVQNKAGSLIPFGAFQNDIGYLNVRDIWKTDHITCFYKERMKRVASDRWRQYLEGAYYG